ncbi:hypothetical protein NX016_26795 [Klebsiella pneumoniae]|uniref:Uncharacterized protein n=3 Tax=Klebsiella TaxID=570 RepID=A0A927DZ64_KLEPN|nr:hypothetical protein [Klebsiella pneumoniae]MBD3721762.1 hypothetical protein [Klebsiella pneumoniae]MDV3425396.1 hypothetical protein [Klebsiella pneumoniae]QPG07975.1 hypothetical protein IUJ34_26370 [Klebsiella pneumoniae subsp. pneumoniae]RRE27919.1 hypothetical protein EAN91_02620 [Klebsiella pneumoniae]
MNDSTVVKEYRRAKLRAAASAIELAITAMEDLINDYDREHTKFSGCHPRQGHASTLRQMQQIHKALKRGEHDGYHRTGSIRVLTSLYFIKQET